MNLPKDFKNKWIALTFDLCEQPYEIAGYQHEIVEYLKKEKIRATFFVGGKWMLSHRDRTEQLITDQLFEVGNHSWEHRNFRVISRDRAATEVLGAQDAYSEIRKHLVSRKCQPPPGFKNAASSAKSMNLFRFPFGACNSESLDLVSELGLLAIQWDVSSGDPDRRLTPTQAADNVVKAVMPGSIVLFHANGRGFSTPKSLPIIVQALRLRGYEFVTVSQLLAVPGAKPEISNSCFDTKEGDTEKYDTLARKLEVQYDRFYREQRALSPLGWKANIRRSEDEVPEPREVTRPKPPNTLP